MDSVVNQINQQLVLSNFINNGYDNFLKIKSSGIMRNRQDLFLSSLENKWTKFRLTHNAIIMDVLELPLEEREFIQAHSYFTEQLFSRTHENYLSAVEQIRSSLSVSEPVVVESNLREEESVVARSSSRINEPIATRDSVITEQPVLTNSLPVQSVSNEIPSTIGYPYSRLPRIKIPTFDGNPTKWLEYRDLFSSMVVSTSLTPVEKLQYLKTSLTGTASQLIQNTALTTENFSKTWESLVSFYDNNRLQVNTALDSLFNLKPMTKESSVELELLYTTVLQIHSTLETLHQPVETWDVIFVHLTVLKLDSESIKAWENTLGSSKIPPSWKELIDFLITRLSSLQAYERSRGDKFTFRASTKHHYPRTSDDDSTSSSFSCSICNGKHYHVRCPNYINGTINQKLSLIAEHGLCFNCLGNHKVSICKVEKRCKKCGQKHHTTVHIPELSLNTIDTLDEESEFQLPSSTSKTE
ncbi:Uncharacterized protein DBV15_12998 [Temnothorax longispinosus]|uniref:Peptidase aspartic putative domain-containing protein n=1 Tax=Temnothorax longispinosus TaxID=300112 RepID=A0A4S2KLI1_9HYME|nr:Uncharacterized protein DBV15_12998 [Temnothorax longispinosus]